MTLTTLILTWMFLLQPSAPWIDGYGETANAIAEASASEPLYAGPRGVERTAALLTSLSWFESRYNPAAIGDSGHSLCLGQVGTSNLPQLGVTRAAMLSDRAVCLHTMLRMIRTSFAVCRGRPMAESLAHYAAGGPTCSTKGATKSGHRMALAAKLLREHPLDDPRDVD